MTTYFISFRKRQFRRTIRIEFAIPAMTKQEARTIAEQELVSGGVGYQYQGVN